MENLIKTKEQNEKTFWTLEKISEFRAELANNIKKKTNNIKHCFILIAIFSFSSIYSFSLFNLSTIGVTSLIISAIGIITCLFYIKKYKIEIMFNTIAKEMPHDSY